MTQEVLKLALDALIWTTGSGDFGEGGQAHEGAKKCLFPAITAIQEALAQLEQEPQIAFNAEVVGYVAPQRTWVGLTDEDISEIVRGTHNTGSFVRAIEAKLKEKNT